MAGLHYGDNCIQFDFKMNKKGSRGAEEGFQVMYTVLFYGDGPSILSYISTTGLKWELKETST